MATALSAMMTVAVATVTLAAPFERSSAFNHGNNLVRGGARPLGAPLNPYQPQGSEVNVWMNAVANMVTPPDPRHLNPPGPSVHDDFEPIHNTQAVAERTLWFEEFPHMRAVLNWQHQRRRQGLPSYKLISQRPGFPFYVGN